MDKKFQTKDLENEVSIEIKPMSHEGKILLFKQLM